MKKLLLATFLATVATGPLLAADIVVTIRDQKGAPIENAVLSLAPKFDMVTHPSADKAEMRQQGAQFAPFVLPVHVGTEVSFPNFDEFRHQVYSFSKAKRFELRLYGQDESKSVTFEHPGVVALGCNIHDNMLAYIYVSDHPVLAKSNSDGVVTISGLDAGSYDTYLWHPDLKLGATVTGEAVTLSDDAPVHSEVTLELRSIRSVQQAPAEDEY